MNLYDKNPEGGVMNTAVMSVDLIAGLGAEL